MDNTKQKSLLALIISITAITIAVLLLYPSLRPTLFGKAIEDKVFNINVECPAAAAAGQEFTCDLVLDGDVLNEVFGAQFVVHAPGLEEGIPFITSTDASLVVNSGGLEGQTVLFKTTEADTLAGPLVQLKLVALTPNMYTVSLSDLIIAAGSAPDTITITGQPATGALSGDINSDGCVNIVDITQIAYNVNLACASTSAAGLVGDVNNDGCVNILDITQIAYNVDLQCSG